MPTIKKTNVYAKRNPFTVKISAGISGGGVDYGFLSPIEDTSFSSACGWVKFDPAKLGERLILWGARAPKPSRVRHDESGVAGFCADEKIKSVLAQGFSLLNPSSPTRNVLFNKPSVALGANLGTRRSAWVSVLVKPVKPDGSTGQGSMRFAWRMPAFQWLAMTSQDFTDLAIQPVNTLLNARESFRGAELPRPGRARKIIANNSGTVDKVLETFYGDGAPLSLWTPVSAVQQQ